MKNRTSFLGLLLILSALFFTTSCSERIDSGHEGVLIQDYGSDKGEQDVALVTGRVWYNPLTETVAEIPLYVMTLDYVPFNVNAKDGSVFSVDPTISIRVLPGSSPGIYRKYRKPIDEVVKNTVYNYTKDAYRIQFNKYNTDDLVSKREEFESRVQDHLISQLETEGFHLEQLTSGLEYPNTITAAIDAKNKAVQDAMRAENELKTTEILAKKKLIEAQAEAEANRIRQQTLTDKLIQQQFIEKWDGKTPLYGGAPVLFKNVN